MEDDSGGSGFFRRVVDRFRDIRPNFGDEKKGERSADGIKAGANASDRGQANQAANALKGAEGAAAGSMNKVGDGLASARSNEQAGGGGLFTGGSGKPGGALSAAKDLKRGNFRGVIKKAGPVTGILLMIFGVGALMSGTQMFQPFAMVEQFRDSFNSMHTSAYNRSARIIRWQLDNGRLKNPVKGSLFGQKFDLSKKQIEKFKEQGIEYDKKFEAGGKKYRVLTYTTDGGQQRIVAATKADAEALRGAGIKNALSIDAAYSDSTFSHKFMASSMTWRGQFANWFGTKTAEFIKNNKLTRNLWQNFQERKAKAEAEGRTGLDVVKDDIGKRTEIIDDGGIRRTTDNGEDAGDNRYSTDDAEKSSMNRKNLNEETIKSKLNNIAKKMGAKNSGTINAVANVACGVFDFIGAVNLVVAGAEALQIMNLTLSFMEGPDKVKAGYGNDSPIHEIGEALNTRAESVNPEFESTGAGGGYVVPETGDTIDLTVSETKTNKTPMQSAGMAGGAMFGHGPVDPNDPNVKTFNLNSSMKRILGGVGVAMESVAGCMIARAATATIEMGKSVLEIGSCLATFWAGGGACWVLAVDTVLGIAAGAGLAAVLIGVATVITPWVSDVLTRDLVSTLGGEELGNALVSGANMYLGSVHRTNGGSLGTRGKYEQFAVAQQQMIAENAREERESLDPFDITSKNTFMGAIMMQLMSFNTANSFTSILKSTNTVMNSSLVALIPSASASALMIEESLPSEEEYKDTCPYLASIGAIGDSYCNPYIITDFSTIDEDVADVVDNLKDNFEENETSDGNVIMKNDSGLAKYAVYCDERTAPFGVASQDIANSVVSTTGSVVGDGAIGSIPALGDGFEILQNGQMLSNLGYISGQSCVAGGETLVGAADSPSWDVARDYQRFIEDQSLMESMGVIEKSAVTAYLEKYYEENPLDDSYEGMLARYSGLDKETVADVLDVVAYFDYINNYNPAERYAFGAPVVDEGERGIQFENENTMEGMTVALEGIIYADVRNRTFVV